MTDQFDPLGRGIGPGSGDHRDPSGDDLHAQLHHPAVLDMAEGRGFPRGADGDEAMDACGDLAFHQPAERGLVDDAVAERCHQSRDHALEEWFRHRPAIMYMPPRGRGKECAAPHGVTSRKRHSSDWECLPATAVSRITSLSDPTQVI